MTEIIGLVGLGNAGMIIAEALLLSNVSLRVFDTSQKAVAEAQDRGASACSSIGELAKSCSVALTCLPSVEAVEEVTMGPGGLVPSMAAGSLLIETSTLMPDAKRRIASSATIRGVGFADVGFSRIRRRPNSCKVIDTVMVGCADEVMQKTENTLGILAERYFHVGPPGMAMVYKLTNNAISHANFLAMLEGVVLAVKAGADPDLLYEVLSNSGAKSQRLEDRYKDRIPARQFSAGASLDSVVKDAEMVNDFAREMGVPLHLNALKESLFRWAQSEGLGQQDYSAMVMLYEKIIGERIVGRDRT